MLCIDVGIGMMWVGEIKRVQFVSSGLFYPFSDKIKRLQFHRSSFFSFSEECIYK